jgi:hypothetical protein
MAIIKQTYLNDGTLISTIIRDEWLMHVDGMIEGLSEALADVAPTDTGNRIRNRGTGVYETMVFLRDRYPTEEECFRYDTQDAALAGHLAAVERWSKARNSEPEKVESDAAAFN